MTSPELANIRKDAQYSALYLAIHKPATVYTAVVNQAFPAPDPINNIFPADRVTQVTYSTGVGNLSDIIPGMTMYVGTTAGAYDVGMCRIRKAPTSTVFYIGENSELAWANGLFLTVVDSMGIWPRHIYLDNAGIPYMDFDIAYSSQHAATDPVPVLGPPAVAWLLGASVNVSFDASASYVLNGATVSGYSWVAPGSSASSGMATATPTITYNAAGQYRVGCTIASSTGTTTTGYRRVFIFDRSANMPINQFDLTDLTGSWQKGGWQAKVTMYSQADFASIVDRAQVVIFARDFYGTSAGGASEVSQGPIAGRENIIFTGWIDGESITEDPDGSSIQFTVSTADAWMAKIAGFPVGIQNTSINPLNWTQWQQLTVDDSIWHALYWQATVIPVIDVFLTGDTRISPEQSVPGEMSLWQQLTYLATNTILARGICDRYNRFFVEIDTDLTPVASRSSIPTVMTLTKQDWRDKATMTRYIVSPTGKIALSGVTVGGGQTPAAIFSLAPGHVFKHFGQSIKQDRLLLADQGTSNVLGGMLLGRDNKLIDFQFDLAGNNRMVDIVPRQYVAVPVAAGDTPRGFTFNGNMIVREIQMSWESASGKESGFLQISWKGESETFPENSSNGDIPNSPAPPSVPPVVTPPVPTVPPTITPPSQQSHAIVVLASGGVWYTQNLGSTGTVNWFAMNSGLPDTSHIRDIKVTASGKLYLWWDDGLGSGGTPTPGHSMIFFASDVGQSWTKVFDASVLGNPEGLPIFPAAGQPNAIINSFGVVPGEDDTVVVLVVGVYTVGSSYLVYPYIGNESGFVLAATHNIKTVAGSQRWGDLQYTTASSWVWSHSLGGSLNLYLSLIARSPVGGLVTADYNCSQAWSDEGAIMCPCNYPTIAALDQGSPTATLSVLTKDGGFNFVQNLMPFGPYPPGSGYPYHAMAHNRTGQNQLLGGSGALALYRSSDFGVTWSATLLAGSTTACFFMGDNQQSNPTVLTESFIICRVGSIYITQDLGVSFTQVTGDLLTWQPAFSPRLIRTW